MASRENVRIRIAAAVLLAAFAAQGLWAMARQSATSDEVPHLAAGYSYLKTGDFRLNPEHPPLVKLLAAAPLLALDLDFNRSNPGWQRADEWAFGEQFINNNRVSAKTIVFWGRVPMLALGLLAGVLVFVWAGEIYGARAGLASLFLYAFSPNMLANATLVTLDAANALFTLLAVYTFYHLLLRPDLRRSIYAGSALGLALATKLTALNLFPIFALLAAIFLVGRGRRAVAAGQVLKWGAVAAGVTAGIVILAYGVASVGAYGTALKYFVKDVGKGGRPTFLFGRYSLQGWRYYFLAAIAIKTPIPMLVMTGLGFAGVGARRRPAFAEYCLIVPVIFTLAVTSLSHLQLGLRYVLQVYPFFFILAGGGAAWLAAGARRTGTAIAVPAAAAPPRLRKASIAVLAGLMAWCAAGTIKIGPHYLAYFNELVGGPRNGYKCLLDSNLDWGQDLPSLASFLAEQGQPEVILSFFGTASPRTYGITYQDFYSYNSSGRREEHVNSLNPQREVLVISANLLESLYSADRHRFDWLKPKRPIARPGYSLFVYDITEDAETHLRLGTMYLAGNSLRKATREFERALVIDPANAEARRYLDLLGRR